ncbi:MAG: response regulator [Fimbriiglobus sp.]
MAKVLIVEDSPIQAKHVEFILRNAGYEVQVVSNGNAALDSIRKVEPDVILTDMHMPEMNGLELVQNLRRDFPSLPVILNTDRGSEELAVQALRNGASGYIPKRNLARDVVALVEEILSVTTSQQKLTQFLTRMTAAEYRFTLENDTDLIAQVVGQVERILTQMQLFDDSEQMRIGVAIHEAVVNGMVHGNLEVSSDLKADDWDAYHALIKAHSLEEPYRSRRVHVTIRATKNPSLEVRVLDEGKGFDPSKIPDPTQAEQMNQACGRGLLLIRTFFDDVRHNATGNEIIMFKGRR